MTLLTRPLEDAISRRRGAQLVCVAVCAVIAGFGCATTTTLTGSGDGWATPVGQGPVGSAHASGGSTAARDLAKARRMARAGEYSLVIPRLQQIISNYPGNEAAVEARFYLGQSYFLVGAYNDALRYLNEYLELAPNGEHVASGREYVARLTERAETSTPSAIEERTQTLKEAVAASPEDMAPRLELANLYWEQGAYADAGATYRELLQRWPGLESDMVVSRRIERGPAGDITLLTPAEVERRYREAEPLLVYNVSSFRSGRFEGWPTTSHERYYNVTGQAMNQSKRILHDVSVIVTIYGLGHMVYDTQTVNLGSLRPGEVRAFSVQFARFDNIHNIARHECVGTFRH